MPISTALAARFAFRSRAPLLFTFCVIISERMERFHRFPFDGIICPSFDASRRCLCGGRNRYRQLARDAAFSLRRAHTLCKCGRRVSDELVTTPLGLPTLFTCSCWRCSIVVIAFGTHTIVHLAVVSHTEQFYLARSCAAAHAVRAALRCCTFGDARPMSFFCVLQSLITRSRSTLARFCVAAHALHVALFHYACGVARR